MVKRLSGSGWLKDIDDNFQTLSVGHPVTPYFVDTNVAASGNGESWENAFKTMAEALDAVETGGTVYFRGDVREEIVGDNVKFDVSIIGVGSLHHPDLPAAGYDGGAAMWRPPASPTVATPLIEVQGRGWNFKNIVFDAPVDAAAVLLSRNALSGEDEIDASHASFIGCLFRQGQYGIEFGDGCHNVTIDGNEFFLMNNAGNTGAGIIQTATSVALGLKNTVKNNIFSGVTSAGGNDRHIVAAWQGCTIIENVFGKVEGTAKYVDLTGGNDNIVADNVMGGAYDTSDYVPGTDDIWLGNRAPVTATTAPYGLSVAVPAAP